MFKIMLSVFENFQRSSIIEQADKLQNYKIKLDLIFVC